MSVNTLLSISTLSGGLLHIWQQVEAAIRWKQGDMLLKQKSLLQSPEMTKADLWSYHYFSLALCEVGSLCVTQTWLKDRLGTGGAESLQENLKATNTWSEEWRREGEGRRNTSFNIQQLGSQKPFANNFLEVFVASSKVFADSATWNS